MSEISVCPKCGGEYVYFDGSLYVCPDCAYEFDGENAAATATADVAKDSNGAELFDGADLPAGNHLRPGLRHPEDPGDGSCRWRSERLAADPGGVAGLRHPGAAVGLGGWRLLWKDQAAGGDPDFLCDAAGADHCGDLCVLCVHGHRLC